jgi:hypothetical protein
VNITWEKEENEPTLSKGNKMVVLKRPMSIRVAHRLPAQTLRVQRFVLAVVYTMSSVDSFTKRVTVNSYTSFSKDAAGHGNEGEG